MKFVVLLFIASTSMSVSKRTYQLIIPKSDSYPYAKLFGTIDRPLEEYTLCHWSRFMDENRLGTIFSYSNDKVNDLIWSCENNEGEYYSVRYNRSGVNVNTGTKPVRWLHICLTELPTRSSVFINGIEVKSQNEEKMDFVAPPNGLVVLGQDAYAGGGGFNSDFKFQGQIADVYFWDRALTSQEIGAVYKCTNTEDANVINWDLHTWQLFNGARISVVNLPCGKK